MPDGRVFGVNVAGGVDSWPSISDWISNSNISNLSVDAYGPEIPTAGMRSGIHGASFDANPAASMWCTKVPMPTKET